MLANTGWPVYWPKNGWLVGYSCLKNTVVYYFFLPSVLWHCWLGDRKGIRPVKIEWYGVDVAIWLEQGADLHMAQLMPLTLIVSCFCKIQIGLPFWYRLTRVVPEKRPLNGCVCVCVCLRARVRACVHVRMRMLRKMPSVLWRCWLGGRKGIRPVKNRVVWYCHGYLSRARYRLAYGPADATATHCLLLQ